MLGEFDEPDEQAATAELVATHGDGSRLGVLCGFTAGQARAMAAAPMFRHMAGDQWEFVELPTWHWPMFSRPAELAEILDGA